MTYDAVETRMIHVVGWRGTCTLWWGAEGSCREHSAHVVHHELRRGDGEAPDDAHDGWQEWEPEPGTLCESCGAPWPGLDAAEDLHHAGGTHQVYDTPTGRPEPGSLFWTDHSSLYDCSWWSNCDGRHLHAVLPNGLTWDIDSRANNCTLPTNVACPENQETGEHSDSCRCRTHRCWQRTGDPETGKVTAGKSPPTCSAGGGSILAGDYHGFLADGVLTAG